MFFFSWIPISSAAWSKSTICEEFYLQSARQKNKTKEVTDNTVQTMISTFANIPPSSLVSLDRNSENYFMNFPVYKKFRRFLKSDMNPHERVFSFIKKYILSFTNSLRNSKLRDISLGKQLQFWGASNDKGYTQLKSLSTQNMNRVIKNFNLIKVDDLPPEIRNSVKNIIFAYRHNTSSSSIKEPVMLSSRRLRKIGLTKTAQSTYTFNQDQLKSDDQLYFYVQPTIRQSEEKHQNISSQYGKNSIYLDENFAEETGWISPYIMTEGDLINYQDSLKLTGFNVDQLTKSQLIELLLLNVYTVTDFTELYRTIVGNYLANNKASQNELPNPIRLFSQINDQDYYNSNDAIYDLRDFMKVYGISGGLMELKVPVAIETKYLIKPK